MLSEITLNAIKQVVKENELDFDDQVIIKTFEEIYRNINDSLLTSKRLKGGICAQLILYIKLQSIDTQLRDLLHDCLQESFNGSVTPFNYNLRDFCKECEQNKIWHNPARLQWVKDNLREEVC